MPSIRPYLQKDRERVQQICLANADALDKNDTFKEYILLMYCNYYINEEPGNCFVAQNDDGLAVGYIICSENYARYEQVFTEKYLPLASKLGPKFYIDAKLDMLSHSMFKKRYKSHLHIDIDENYQRMGLGSQLISALKEHLKAKGYRGVMLVVGSENEQGINFYRKNGFHSILSSHLGVAMAIDF